MLVLTAVCAEPDWMEQASPGYRKPSREMKLETSWGPHSLLGSLC